MGDHLPARIHSAQSEPIPKPTTSFKDYERFFEVFTKDIPETDGHQYVEKKDPQVNEAPPTLN